MKGKEDDKTPKKRYICTCTSMFFLFTSFHYTRSLNILHAELQSKTGNGLEVMTENLLNGT